MLPSVAPGAAVVGGEVYPKKKLQARARPGVGAHARFLGVSASSPIRGREAALEFRSCGVRQPPFQMKLKAMKLNQVLAYVPETTREGMRLTSTLGLPPQRNS